MRNYLLPAFILLFASCNNETSNTPNTESSAPVVVDKGQALFRQYCSTCHNPLKNLTGPALKGAVARWNNDTVSLKAFIHNPGKMIASGDARAVAAFEAYKPTVMTAFPQLSDEDLDLIIHYFENAR